MSSTDRSQLARGYAIAILAATIFSFTGIIIRHLTQSTAIPALVLAFWRDTFVVLTLLPMLLLAPGLSLHAGRGHGRYLLLYGLVLAVFNSLWTLSVALNGAAVATVLAYCSAAFTALLGWRLFGERLDAPKLLAVALSLGGCALVSGALDPAAWSANTLGILTGILSGLAYAAYTLMGRSAAQRGLNPWTALFYTFGVAALVLLGVNLLPGEIVPGAAVHPAELFWLGRDLAGWGFLLLLAAGPTVFGYGLYNVSLGMLPSSVANLILTLEPVLTAIIAAILLDERFTLPQLIGGLLIVAALVFLRISEGRSQPDEAVQRGRRPLRSR